jgi:hypothetical protein
MEDDKEMMIDGRLSHKKLSRHGRRASEDSFKGRASQLGLTWQ